MCNKHDDHNKTQNQINASGDNVAAEHDKSLSRREFMQNSAALGAGLMLTGSSPLFAAVDPATAHILQIASSGKMDTISDMFHGI